MKKIIINILGFIFLLFAGFTLLQSLEYRAMNTEFVACGVDAATGSYYEAGNILGQSVIYKVNREGRVIDAYDERFTGAGEKLTGGRILDLCYADDVYYIAKATTASEGSFYKLGRLTEKLDVVTAVACSDFMDTLTVSKINVVEQTVYMTMITADHLEVYVYAVDLDQSQKSWSLLSRQSAGEGRYFIEALYTGTLLQAGLDNGSYVYYEADREHTLADDRNLLKNRQEMLTSHRINLSSLQILLKVANQIVWQNLVTAMVCAAVVLAIYIMFTSRFYALKQYAIIVSALFVMIAGSVIFFMRLNSEHIQDTYLKNVQLCFEFFDRQYSNDNAYFLDAKDYYNSQDYCRAYDDMAEFAANTKFVRELMLVHVDGNNRSVMVSLNSYRTAAEKLIFTGQIELLMQEARENASIVYQAKDLLGGKYGLFVMPLRDNALVKKYIVSVISLDSATKQSNQERVFLLLTGAVLLLLAVAAAGVVIRSMTKDIREFNKAMLANTEEAILVRKPSVNNNEVEFMWNALAEVTKRYEKVNYLKYRVLQAYYRFAPRKIENILGKDSIIDVGIGDVVHVDATMAMVALRDKRDFGDRAYMDGVYRDFKVIGKYQVEEDGVIINMNSSLTYLKMLFMEQHEKALRFGVNVVQTFAQEEAAQNGAAFVLLHSARFLYGVSGNSEQTFPFTVSAETESLDRYVERFRKADAGLVITESVELPGELMKGCRYIGYVFLAELERKVRLYQVLDAYQVSRRNRYLAVEDFFQRALKAFYNNEFYRARNTFTDVLKGNPEDEIARWYLFTCEKFLNAAQPREFDHSLFSE